ncbi:MAG: hypothetical protein K0R09_1644 [Clostridiales bacterium]|jgi:hypothetical protein|nr:hypothetical protein [Clostridiales bacterium]
MLNISCNIILDLIPLVKDGVASIDSTNLVNEHVKSCESCKAEFDSFENICIETPSIKDEKIIFDIKRSIFITQVIILISGAIVGVALSNSMNMFYNFIIMPITGAISFITFNRKCYLAVIAVFILSFTWISVGEIISGGFRWTALYGGLFFSLIYALLIGIGVVIAILLKFAFKKER